MSTIQAAAAVAVPRALLLRLYRQLLRSSRSYGQQASMRELTIGRELQRLLSVPQRTATLNQPTTAISPTATSLSAQLEQWVKRRPTLFQDLNAVTIGKRRKSMASANPAATLHPTTNDTSSASISAATISASTSVTTASTAPTLPLAPTELDRVSPFSPDSTSSNVAPTPNWVKAAYEAGLESTPVSFKWIRVLLRAAFRQPPSAYTKEIGVDVRMSNAFALHKRFFERAAELSFLPLTPLATSASTVIPDLVKVELRSLGLYKSFRSNYWFQLEWRVENISHTKTLVLQNRTLRTQERALGASTTNPFGVGTAGAVTTTSLTTTTTLPSSHVDLIRRGTPPASSSSPSSASRAHTSAASSSSLGGPPTLVSGSLLSVASTGTGLRGRPIGLPAGSAVERELVNIRLDSSLGVLIAELKFLDYSSTPPKEVIVALQPILLDANAPPPPPAASPSSDAPSSPPQLPTNHPRRRDETRELLTGALQLETTQLTQSTTPSSSTDAPAPSSSGTSETKPSTV